MTPVIETYTSGGKPVTMELFLPASEEAVPLVLVLHGSFGLLPQYRPDIVSFATALKERGIAAALPHYLDVTGTTPGQGVLGEIAARSDQWHDACSDALETLASDDQFNATSMGVLGFSLGGYLALRVAMAPPAPAVVRGAVDFFGPVRMLEVDWSALPRLLILHGDADPLVNPAESSWLAAGLVKAGLSSPADFELVTYPGEGHGFKGAALADSRERTCSFFEKLFEDGRKAGRA